MGIFDSDDEEVKISPDDGENESRLKDEVETEIVDSGEEKNRGSSRGKTIRERSNSKGKSTFGDDREVSLQDIHRQNKKIISLLEDIADKSRENDYSNDDYSKDDDDSGFEGDMSGVL